MNINKVIVVLCIVAITAMLMIGCAKRTQEAENEEDLAGDEFDELAVGFDEDAEDVDAAAEEEAEEEDNAPAASATPVKKVETSAKDASVKRITVTEGELVSVDVRGTDPDGDSLVYAFTKPLNSQGKWQTKRGDAGMYRAEITASDSKTAITKTVEIEVLKTNQPPVMERLSDVSVEEGDSVTLDPKVTDPDSDRVTVSYSGWMVSSLKTTGYDDAGTYVVTITATDGEYEVSQDVRVTVQDVNRAPEFDIVLQ